MLRKEIRQRREFLFNMDKSAQNQNQIKKKMLVKESIESDGKKKLPTELYKEKEKLKKQLILDDANSLSNLTKYNQIIIRNALSVPRTHIDDEYNVENNSGVNVVITSSRDASPRLTQFLKEMKLIFPNSMRLNRGSYKIKDLVEFCQKKSFTDLIILHEHRGEPDGMIVSHFPYGPTIHFGLSNTVLRHDLKEKAETMSEAYPHLIFHNFNTELGERIKKILQHLFPIPKTDSKRVITFANNDDIISFRHHIYERETYNSINMSEIGPRFDLKPFQITLGLLNMPEAKKEWVLRPYMNTATKRKAIQFYYIIFCCWKHLNEADEKDFFY